MKDTLYSQKFRNSKGEIVEKWVWVSKMNREEYPLDQDNKTPLEPVFEEIKEESNFPTIITKKMSRQEIQVERRKRSSDHFKKEILPTLGKDEKIHHKIKSIQKK